MAHTTASDGTRIHWTLDAGEGPVVVLIQGLGLSSAYWADVPDTLREAPEKFRVLLVDNRCTGQSGIAKRMFSVRRMADDVAAVMKDAGVESAVIAGISMGGMIAQELALRHPEKVRGLVLLATTPGLPHGKLAPIEAIGFLLRIPFARTRDARETLYARFFFDGQPAAEAQRLAKFLMSTWEPLFLAQRLGPREYFLQFAAAASHAASRQLARISCPTHVMSGDCDRIIHPENARLLAERIPGATVEMLPGVGHAVPVQDREAILRGVRIVRERAASRAA